MMSMYKDHKDEWFRIWEEDQESLLSTMIRNMSADIDAGYSPFGITIKDQERKIKKFENNYKDQIMKFAAMQENEVDRWCFYNLKSRGAIE